MKNIFELNRDFWDFSFSNPEKIRPNHCAVYYFALEHCNRLGWKDKYGFPTSMVMEATGIKSYSVYKKTFDELVEFGFIEVVEYSRNQYSSNVISLCALKENYKAPSKALDKALIKHTSKQCESTFQSTVESSCESTSSIIIQDTIDNKTNSPDTIDISGKPKNDFPTQPKKKSIEERKSEFGEKLANFKGEYSNDMLLAFYNYWTEHGDNDIKMRFEKEKTFGVTQRLATWKRIDFGNKSNNNNHGTEQRIKSGGVSFSQSEADDLQRRTRKLLGLDADDYSTNF